MGGSVKGRKSNGSGRPSETKQTKVIGKQEPPQKPADLVGHFANQLWDEAVASLPHILRPIDFAILRCACDAFEISQTGDSDKIRLTAARAFETFARQIGLTPSSRRIVKPVDGAVDDAEDPLTDWLKRGGLN